MMRLARLQQMDANLARGLQAIGNDFIQRQALESIIKDAFYAGVPPLDYLREKLQPVSAAASPASGEYKCLHPACKDRPAFNTQMALNGHMKKHVTL